MENQEEARRFARAGESTPLFSPGQETCQKLTCPKEGGGKGELDKGGEEIYASPTPGPLVQCASHNFHNLSLIQIDFLLFCGGMGKRELFFFFQFGLKCASPQIYQLQKITAPNFYISGS